MPTTPEIKSTTAVLDAPAPPSSPRLRHASVVIFQPPPVTPKLKTTTAAVAPMVVATTPRVRHAFAVPGPNPLRLLPLPPNWEDPVVEGFEFSTDIMTAHDQTEQCMGNRGRARRTFEFRVDATAEELPHVEAMLYAIQGQAMEVPIWTDQSLLTAEVEIGADEITVDTTGLDYAAGCRVVLMERDRFASGYGSRDEWYEVLDADSLSGTGLVLASTPKRAWPVGTRIAPVRPCLVATSTQWIRAAATKARATISLELTDQGYPNLPAHTADLYDGRPVLPWRPNRDPDISHTHGRVLTRIQSVGGTVSVYARRDRPTISTGHRFDLEGRAQILAARSLIEAIGGARGKFWATSGMRDLELARPASSGDSYIVVKSVRGHEWYQKAWGPIPYDVIGYSNPGRRDVEIRATPTGTAIRRRIKSWTRIADGLEQVQLDSALGAELTTGQSIVSWLVPSRLESDRVEFRWTTNRVVELELDMRSL